VDGVPGPQTKQRLLLRLSGAMEVAS